MKRFLFASLIVVAMALLPVTAFANTTYTYTILVTMNLSKILPDAKIEVGCGLWPSYELSQTSGTNASAQAFFTLDGNGSFSGKVPVVVQSQNVPQHYYKCNLMSTIAALQPLVFTVGSF